MVISTGKVHVSARVHVQRRRDVDHAELEHALREIQRQPVRHPAAAVVAAEEKPVHAQRVERGHHIAGHGALAGLFVARCVRRCGGVAIAAQVRHDDPVGAAQPLGHALPHHVRLRKTVQQHQHRALRKATHAQRDVTGCVGGAQRYLAPLESVKPGCVGHGVSAAQGNSSKWALAQAWPLTSRSMRWLPG